MNILDGNKERLDYKNQDIWIFIDSHIEHESRVNSCKKEPDTVQWIEEYFRPGDVVFDIGANIGAYTLIMSKIVGNKGRVYSFEPNWINFFQLNRNIVLNNSTENVVALNIALSSSKCIDDFNYRDLISGSSLHTFGEPIDFIGDKFTPDYRQRVCSLSIDQFAHEYILSPINHIKIDVDGIEGMIIKGGAETFSSKQCKSIMVELNEDFVEDMEAVESLVKYGFTILKKVHNPSKYFKSEGLYNYFFVR